MQYSVDGGVTWIDADEVRIAVRTIKDAPADKAPECLYVTTVTCTNEGMITDTWFGDENVYSAWKEWNECLTTTVVGNDEN